MSFEAESNSELTVIVPAYQLHFRFSVQNKIHKQKILSDTWTSILGSIAGPCDFLPTRSDEFQKVWYIIPTCLNTCIMMTFSLTLHDKVSPGLMKLYFYIVDLTEGVKWMVIMLRELVLQCTNCVFGIPQRQEKK
jgi:hypothetical protein